jgi:cysteine-rich repeat protein
MLPIGKSLLALACTLSLSGCLFDPDLNRAAYPPCGPAGECKSVCRCLDGKVCVPVDSKQGPEICSSDCGNGALDIDRGEECDDGNRINGDGCDDACQYEPVGRTCGDGTPDPLEKCDDGNTTNGDGCNPTCNLTTTVTTLAAGLQGEALAVDDTYLWIGTCDPPTGPTVCEIRRLDIDACLQTGKCTPTTVAGGACGAPRNGRGTSAVLSCVTTVTTDGSTLWFGNQHTVRAMDMQTFEVTTIAGYQDGQGAAVLLSRPRALTSDGTSIYFNEQMENTVRQVIIETLDTSTLVGIRGCPGSRDGVGGDGSQDWSVPGCGTAPAGLPQIDTPMAGLVYHFPSRSIFLAEGGNLRRIE